MRVLAFGTYDRAYPRNAQVLSCLRQAGVEVIEWNRPVWRRHNWSVGPRGLVRLGRAELALARSRPPDADAVLVGYPGHLDLPAARRASPRLPIVFNPLVSLHDTLVTDRGRFRPDGLAARVIRRLDLAAFAAADIVVADTAAHADFFARALGVPAGRLEIAFVGAEDRHFRPRPGESRPFTAVFVGKLVPLHGLETILAAARLAPEVPFTVVGEGQLARLLAVAPTNVTHVPWLDYDELPSLYSGAGCALGIFGTGEKAARVIPNKAFQAIACAAPLITADTPAARELLTHETDALLVPAGDPTALARAVRRLAADGALAARIGAGGRETYVARASEAVLAKTWHAIFERALTR